MEFETESIRSKSAGLVVEEDTDLSQERPRNEWMNECC
jgi:hypothetical protein